MSKKYKNSPIIEAVCEFQFKENLAWDMTIPGLVYEKVQDNFPIRRQAARVAVGISNTSEDFGPQVGTVSLMQFLREDEKALIQIGPHLLSVSVLKPYPSWQHFLPLIQNGFHAYCAVAAPESVQRIGLRYINHIAVPGQNIRLEDYFNFRPFVGADLPQDFGTFAVSIQVPYENFRDILNLQLTSLPIPRASTDDAAMILSLDYFLVKPEAVTLEEAFKWVETAHVHISNVFEACITKELRKLFEEAIE